MSKQTRKSTSSSTAATVEETTGVQEDAARSTSTASDPSGLRAPDGINSTNTPQSSGDAAGDTLADLVKPQVNSDHTETTMVEKDNPAPKSEVEASASGNSSTGPSQDEEIGTGANAGSGQQASDLSSLLIQTGTASLEHLIRVSAIGKDTLSVIESVSATYPRFQEWLGADDPAEIIAALVEEIDVLQRTIDLIEIDDDTADLDQDRPFPKAVRVKAYRTGFRRAGLVLSSDWESFAAGVLTVKQFKALENDPDIDVEYL